MKKPIPQEGLKLLACGAMLVDHWALLFGKSLWYRALGRLAFPIYCFLISEGLAHTRNRRRYFGRLALMALLTEPIYDLAFYPQAIWQGQNVLFTLLLGGLLLRTLGVLVVLLRRALEIVLLRARLVLAALRLRRTLAVLLLRTRRIVLLRPLLVLAALRARLTSALRVLRGRGGLGLLCGRGCGRFLLCRGCGKDLLDRIDLVLLRDIVENHVQLVFR